MRFGLDASPGSLERDIGRCVGLLRAELPAGSVVALASEDERAVAVISLAVLRAGHTLLPLDPRSKAPEVLDALALAALGFFDPAPAARWAWSGRVIRVEPPPAESLLGRMLGRKNAPVATFPAVLRDRDAAEDAAASPGSVAVLLRTSGTTGGPKLVPWTRAALDAQLPILRRALQIDSASRVLNLLPAFHIDGLVMGIYLCAHTDAALLRLPRTGGMDVQAAADLVFRERCTHLIAVPAVLGLLPRLGADLAAIFGEPSFRAFVSTAAPLPDRVWRRLEEAAGKPVINVYGLTETGNLLFAGPDADTGVVGTVGRAQGCALRVVGPDGSVLNPGEQGELALRGPTVARVFQDGTPAVDAEGWFATGDLAILGEDGLVRVVGRARGLISVGGLKVAPIEVERALLEIDGVSDARVFGEPDPAWGERVVAEVVGDGLELERVTAALRERLSEHKVPREIRLSGQIVRGATGKVAAAPALSNTIEDRVLALAAGVFRVPASQLSLGSRIEQVPGWDSVGHLDLIAALERDFGLTLGLNDMMQIRCIGDAVRLIEARGFA